MDIEDVHKNTKLLINNIPFNVDEAEFVKPGKGRAIYHLKLRNLLENTVIERTFHSGEKVEEAHTNNYEMQYLYKEGDHYIFMNTESFEQLSLSGENIGDKKYFLKEGTVVNITMLGDRPIGVVIPNFVELEVKESEISSRTDTISAQTKSAVMETGATIAVPPFIKIGDILKIDTRTGIYVERISTKK